MIHQVRISDDTMARLKDCAEPFMDKEPEDVIRRLLDAHEKNRSGRGKRTAPSDRAEKEIAIPLQSYSTNSRAPRERGATIEMGGHRIQAATVPDLYEQVLRFLADKHGDQLRRLLPFPTSRERYLVADKPVHPSGKNFFIPVEHHGYCMEAHKDYKNAIEHLEKLASRLGLPFKYLG